MRLTQRGENVIALVYWVLILIIVIGAVDFAAWSLSMLVGTNVDGG